MKKKRILFVLFLLYLVVVLRVIVFKYPLEVLLEIASGWSDNVLFEGKERANFQLFKTIRLYIKHWDNHSINSFGNLVGNVVIFIPLGYFLPRLFQTMKNVFCTMAVSLCLIVGIETFQLISGFGVFDVDDILLNSMGALIGYLIFRLFCKNLK